MTIENPAEAKPSRWKTPANWFLIGAGILTGAVALFRFFDTSLPSCTASNVSSTLVRIAREQGVQGPKVTDLVQTADAIDERRCTATLTNEAGATSQMTIRIYRSDDRKTQIAAQWQRI
ncbi:hypothetical protein [Phreatobacter sp.]|uniref:hypothetical protein n=1 Tax=Phreatobacter sp. TaxID=1966341 RepID=UPI003F724192